MRCSRPVPSGHARGPRVLDATTHWLARRLGVERPALRHLPATLPRCLIRHAMDRPGDTVTPTLVIASRDDFLFPPEHQVELAAGIPDARLRIVERAGHNAHAERPAEVMAAVRGFLLPEVVLATAAATAVSP